MPEPADRGAQLPQPSADARPLPVLAEARPLPVAAEQAPLGAVAAAGAVGFLAGVASWLMLRVLRRPHAPRAARALGRRRAKGLEVTATRSFLVDVHILRDR
jgi:hypothetical protein